MGSAWPNRAAAAVAFLILLVVTIPFGHLGVYGLVAAGAYGVKLLASLAHRPHTGTAPPMSIAVVVPTYNEDPGTLVVALRSILGQARAPQAVIVVDDGSTDGGATGDAARGLEAEFWSRGIRYRALEQANAGKRHALAAGFRAEPGVDAYLCVDSDTILAPTALGEALRPFADPRVTAVTGLTVAANHGRNVLTRLINIRYACAFLVDRAAYSTLGAVLCCCGSLSVYRADRVHQHLDAFLGQTFMGSPATFGDDRHMTNLLLQDGGRVVLQESSVAYTAVPERVGHYARQQTRWNKSFFRESLWVLRHRPSPVVVALTLYELLSTTALTLLLAHAVIWRPVHDGVGILAGYALWVALMGWVRSVRALSVRQPGQSRRDQAWSFLLAPAYGLLTLGVVVPLRAWALLTINESGWGTRDAGAEVSLTERAVTVTQPSVTALTERAG